MDSTQKIRIKYGVIQGTWTSLWNLGGRCDRSVAMQYNFILSVI